VAFTITGFDSSRLFAVDIFKRKVFSHRLQDIEDLKVWIRHELYIITKDILHGRWTALAACCSSAL
jgi:hypothetical protein